MKLRLVFTTLGPLTLSLLLAAYSPPAHAVTIIAIGEPGVDGAPGVNGGPGGDAPATTPPNNDPSNTANATGGAGGTGGAAINNPATPAGNGGAGGNAAATAVTSTANGAGNGFATATSTGGAGGVGGAIGISGLGGSGGPGGNATSNAIVINVPNASVSSTANGGAGGSGCTVNCSGGNGGTANAQATGIAATRSRSLRQQWAETEVLAAPTLLMSVVMAALPPYRAAGSVRQFLAVRLPAAQAST